jgi:hypothetical protein
MVACFNGGVAWVACFNGGVFLWSAAAKSLMVDMTKDWTSVPTPWETCDQEICCAVLLCCVVVLCCVVPCSDPEAGLEALLAMTPPLKPDIVLPILQVRPVLPPAVDCLPAQDKGHYWP